MGRSIVNAVPSAASATRSGPGMPAIKPAIPGDEYGDRFLKLIPAEVITLYLAMDAVITSNGDNNLTMALIVFGIGVVSTWFYLKVFQKVDNMTQIVVSVVAFAVWAFNTGHEFRELEGISPSYGALALLVFTFFAPKIPMGKAPEPEPAI